MRGVAATLLTVALAAGSSLPLEVQLSRSGAALEVRLTLNAPLPALLHEALPSGAQVRIVYPIQVRSRRALLWDRRVWRGELVSTVAFDPLTGRYRCELLLNDVIVASRETTSPDVALEWLRTPPPFRVILPPTRHALYLRVRAVYSSTTTWLVLPQTEGTDWTVVPVREAR
ncbi:MAG: DUF4390 domain-containing protein [Acidobacteria bacterium]|jgi:hypothetical protein|nr:DUF4390 domain-containing protein [Acidobacteriota bacterium]